MSFLLSECAGECDQNQEAREAFISRAECIDACVSIHKEMEEEHVTDYWRWWDEVEEAGE